MFRKTTIYIYIYIEDLMVTIAAMIRIVILVIVKEAHQFVQRGYSTVTLATIMPIVYPVSVNGTVEFVVKSKEYKKKRRQRK